jgi:hypothetical protein
VGASCSSRVPRCSPWVDPFVFGPSATSASAAIASLLYSVRRNRRSDAAAESVDEHGRLGTHVAFQQAAVSVLQRSLGLARDRGVNADTGADVALVGQYR